MASRSNNGRIRQSLGGLRRLFAELERDRRGNVIMLFGLSLITLVVGVGSAVDYSQAARSRSHIATSADAAALAAAKAAQNYMNTAGTSAAAFTAASALAQIAMTQTFTANQAGDNYSKNVQATLAMTQAGDGSPVATVTAGADAPTTFMKIVGIPLVQVGSVAQAKGAGGSYFQIIFLVDVSNSMAVGGTAEAITSLNGEKTIKCAFACHDPNGTLASTASDWCEGHPDDYFCRTGGQNYCPFGNGKCATINPSRTYSDRRALAQRYGIKLKIDYVNDAVNTFLTRLKPYMDRAPQFYRVAIDTFGTTYAQIQAPTNDTTQLAAAAKTIDIEVAALNPGPQQGWTYTSSGLQKSLAKVSNIGDGSSASKRRTFFVFLTDGVEDIPGSIIYGRKSTLDYTAVCQTIKNSGASLFAIEAAYPVITPDDDGQYQKLVGNLPASQISVAMRGCASSSDKFFFASNGPGIETAVQQTFDTIFGTGSLHLSR